VAIGYWAEGEKSIQAQTLPTESLEREALTTFWKALERRRLVGFNARSFDVPTLIQRSRYLDVRHPYISLARFGKGDVTDLRDLLTFDDARYEAIMPKSLSAFCRRFGIDVPDALTGADVAAAVKDGRWGDVEGHVRADVLKTALLASRLGYFRVQCRSAA
jgi:DNA polymerase III epsilon subunit-like protein